MVKKMSDCGHACQVIFGVVIMILIIISFSTTWWLLYWDDCDFDDDASISLNLHLGACLDGMDDCTSWKDLDRDDNGDSDLYIAAHGICITALVFCVLSIVVTCGAFIPAIQKANCSNYLSYVLMVLLFICSIFLIGALASTSDTYYTDTDNFPIYGNFCESKRSTVSIGWVAALIAVILAYVAILVAACPCCICANDSKNEEDSKFMPASSTQ